MIQGVGLRPRKVGPTRSRLKSHRSSVAGKASLEATGPTVCVGAWPVGKHTARHQLHAFCLLRGARSRYACRLILQSVRAFCSAPQCFFCFPFLANAGLACVVLQRTFSSYMLNLHTARHDDLEIGTRVDQGNGLGGSSRALPAQEIETCFWTSLLLFCLGRLVWTLTCMRWSTGMQTRGCHACFALPTRPVFGRNQLVAWQSAAYTVEALGQCDLHSHTWCSNRNTAWQAARRAAGRGAHCGSRGQCDLHSRAWLWKSRLGDQKAGVASGEAHKES